VLYFNLFYISYLNFLCNYFLKFIAHKIDSKIVKSEMVMLISREKTNVVSIDVVVD
jgi:hypothetical protein